MEIKRLNFDFDVKADDATRTIEGMGSVFNNVDYGNDIVMPGAFSKSLKKIKSLPMLWQHSSDQVIGVWNEIEETDAGLRMKGVISDTTLGRDAYTLAKDGAVKGMSIGYGTKKFDIDPKGIRKLIELDLHEVSLVTFPMNDKATITRVKSAHDNERDFEDFLREAGYSRDAAKIITAKGFKALNGQREADEQGLTTICNLFNQITNYKDSI